MNDDTTKIAEAIEKLAEAHTTGMANVSESINTLAKAIVKLGSIDDYKGATDCIQDGLQQIAEALRQRTNSN